MIIRKAYEKDITQIKELFQQTILSVNTKDYTLEQAECWSSRGSDVDIWKERIIEQYFIINEENNLITGFAALKPDGYLNSMFVHKDYQGRGIASLLLKDVECYANRNDIVGITADVSITAKPFFEKKGYVVLNKQTVDIGIKMVNYKMKKNLYLCINEAMRKYAICQWRGSS